MISKAIAVAPARPPIMPPSAMRSLFLAYVAQANGLVHSPRFYNTVTVNCTTLIYHMMKRIDGNLPLDYRLLLSGYLPGYVYKAGGLDSRYTLAQLRACYPTGLVVAERGQWRSPWSIQSGVADYIETTMEQVKLPMPTRLLAYRWRTSVPDSTANCAAIHAIVHR